MNTSSFKFRASKTVRKNGAAIVLASSLAISGGAVAQQQNEPAKPVTDPVAESIAKMMDPTTYAVMMTMAMDPRIWMNPISSCAACHNNEDVARYQQVFGPFTSMMNPAMWATPDAYNEMMASMFDARAAEEWSKAVMKKYGLQPGDPMPTMHSGWPWPTTTMPVPMPAPVPAQ